MSFFQKDKSFEENIENIKRIVIDSPDSELSKLILYRVYNPENEKDFVLKPEIQFRFLFASPDVLKKDIDYLSKNGLIKSKGFDTIEKADKTRSIFIEHYLDPKLDYTFGPKTFFKRNFNREDKESLKKMLQGIEPLVDFSFKYRVFIGNKNGFEFDTLNEKILEWSDNIGVPKEYQDQVFAKIFNPSIDIELEKKFESIEKGFSVGFSSIIGYPKQKEYQYQNKFPASIFVEKDRKGKNVLALKNNLVEVYAGSGYSHEPLQFRKELREKLDNLSDKLIELDEII
jgi:hypothetical protein